MLRKISEHLRLLKEGEQSVQQTLSAIKQLVRGAVGENEYIRYAEKQVLQIILQDVTADTDFEVAKGTKLAHMVFALCPRDGKNKREHAIQFLLDRLHKLRNQTVRQAGAERYFIINALQALRVNEPQPETKPVRPE